MNKNAKYYLVAEDALPRVFSKVVQAKKLIDSGDIKNVNHAVKEVGISRSVYYKYKDHVFSLSQAPDARTIALHLILEDVPGILSRITSVIAHAGANILTINQNIPVNNMANVNMTINVSNVEEDIEDLISSLHNHPGVKKLEILSRTWVNST